MEKRSTSEPMQNRMARTGLLAPGETRQTRPTAEHPHGRRPGLVAALRDLVRRAFGCRHRQLGLPITLNRETYRVCLYCGARQQFVPERWETTGRFYR